MAIPFAEDNNTIGGILAITTLVSDFISATGCFELQATENINPIKTSRYRIVY
jgi:hypothetical protein